MDGLVDRERRIGVLDSRRRRAIQHGVGGEIETVKAAVLGRDRQQLLSALRLDQRGRG